MSVFEVAFAAPMAFFPCTAGISGLYVSVLGLIVVHGTGDYYNNVSISPS